MLKGKSVIELTNIKTGEKERYEDCNLVTEAVQDVLSVNLMGMLYNNTYFNGNYGEGWMLPLKKNIMGGILLYRGRARGEDRQYLCALLESSNRLCFG